MKQLNIGLRLRDNCWSPYPNSRICSLHFKDSDYYDNNKNIIRRRLKPDVIPTQHVHTNILQILQENSTLQNEIYTIKKCKILYYKAVIIFYVIIRVFV